METYCNRKKQQLEKGKEEGDALRAGKSFCIEVILQLKIKDLTEDERHKTSPGGMRTTTSVRNV